MLQFLLTQIGKLKAAVSSITSSMTNTKLEASRTDNDYVDADGIGRLWFYKKSGVLFANLNIGFNSSFSAMSDFVEICTISGWSAVNDIYAVMYPQNGGDKPLTVSISPSGSLKIYGKNGISSGFYRTEISAPAA